MARILLVGTDRNLARGIRSMLGEDGHDVTLLRSAERWRAKERQLFPELVVAAVESPEEVLRVPGRNARGFPAPLLLVQADGDLFARAHADERLVDQIESPFMAPDLLARVDALIRARRVVRRSGPVADDGGEPPARRPWLSGFGKRVAAVLGPQRPRYEKPLAPYLDVASRIADWADRRDVFEPGHTERVASLSVTIGEALGLPDREIQTVVRAAMLHDIGKVSLPVEVLRAAGPLRDDQRRMIQTHPHRGAVLLRALTEERTVAEAILCHHEQPDGAGYYGKPRDMIPRAASILGAAEAYDAMTTTRLQQPLSREAALQRIRQEAGWKYDSDCVEALVDALTPRKTTLQLARRP